MYHRWILDPGLTGDVVLEHLNHRLQIQMIQDEAPVPNGSTMKLKS